MSTTETVLDLSANLDTPAAALKQPKALLILSMTEVWERFAYWALYSLLVLYMLNTLHFSDAKAYLIFGAFNALMYATPIIGGWLADKYLSEGTAIVHGGIWLAIGYLMIAFSQSPQGLFIALAILIWGNGLFKPSISTILGSCYSAHDPRRDRGFTLYYMAINVGATVGVLGCGWLSMQGSWKLAFIVVAMAMLLGQVNYLLQINRIKADIRQHKIMRPTKSLHLLTTLLGILIIGISYFLIKEVNYANAALLSTIVGLSIYLTCLMKKQTTEERGRTLSCLILIIASIAFWALYMQMGSSLTTFTERCVNLQIAGYKVNAPMVSSLNGFWLFGLSPLLVLIWSKLQTRKVEPDSEIKFCFALLAMALGYGVLVIALWNIQAGEKISLWWITSSYGLQTLGELCLSPIGLAMITKLAPTSCRGLLMGIWYLALAIASLVSGQLAKLATIPTNFDNEIAIMQAYQHAFSINTLLAIIASVLLICFFPMLKRLRAAI